MRSVLVSAWALLILSGCGRNASEPPEAAVKSSPKGNTPAKKEGAPAGKQGAGEPKGEPAPQVKQGTLPVGNGPGFDADDAQQTLRWLIRSAAKLRATPPKDQAAAEQEWKSYTEAVKAAYGRKIRWELAVESVNPKGIVTETIKARDDSASVGLRLQPAKQIPGLTTFTLDLPGGTEGLGLRAGSRVLVTGEVARIDTTLKSHPHAPTYEFDIRLNDYKVTPVK